jgi:AraC-like DNA-binding protein
VLNNKYLNLKTIRLKPKEEWVYNEEGVSFLFPRSGVGAYATGSIQQRVTPGDILVFKREMGGKLGVMGNNEMIFWQFSVAFENLYPLFSTNEIPLLQDVTENLKQPIVYSSSKQTAKDCHRLLADVSSQFDLLHRSQLLRVVAVILGEEFKRARGERVGFVRAEDHMMQVFEKLPVDDLLTLSVGELADRFGCSRRHLSRLFHRHFGLSVAALRMEMRLLKAMSLLRDPNSKIIHVAEKSGFNHLGLFNICFKRRFGTSPGQWRKMNQDSPGLQLRTNGLGQLAVLAQNSESPGHNTEVIQQKGNPSSEPKGGVAGIKAAYPKQKLSASGQLDARQQAES